MAVLCFRCADASVGKCASVDHILLTANKQPAVARESMKATLLMCLPLPMCPSICPSVNHCVCVCVCMQLRKQLALEVERQVKSGQGKAVLGNALLIPQWCTTDEPLHLISILKAYRDLGFHPSQGLLTAAEPFLSSLQIAVPLQQALDLIMLFRAFAWQPGQSAPGFVAIRTGCSCLHPSCIWLYE